MGSAEANHTMELNDKSTVCEKPKKRNKNVNQFDYAEIQQMLPEQFDDLYKTLPITEDTTCGLWIFKGDFFQK
jgi:hypothetical protein